MHHWQIIFLFLNPNYSMNKTIRSVLAVSALGAMLIPAMVLAGKGYSMGSKPAIKLTAKETVSKVKKHMSKKATLVSVGADSVILKDAKGMEVTVMVTVETKLTFRGGKLMLSEFLAGDKVEVKATKNDAGAFVAKRLLNLSLRKGAIHGTVKNLSGSAFEVETNKRGAFMVTVGDATKFHFDEDKPATLADLKNGSVVTVKGSFRTPGKTFATVNAVVIGEPEETEISETSGTGTSGTPTTTETPSTTTTDTPATTPTGTTTETGTGTSVPTETSGVPTTPSTETGTSTQ